MSQIRRESPAREPESRNGDRTVGGALDAQPTATIADTSYRNYDGPRSLPALRFWVIALYTIRQNVNRTKLGYWFPAGFILLAYFITGAIFYVTQSVRQFGVTMPGDTGNPFALTLYQCLVSSDLMLFAASLTVGAGAIAADNRANALLVYLSRPLKPIDYLLGKWVGVFLLIAALSVVPTLLMYLFFVTAYWNDGFSEQAGPMLGKLLVASLIGPLLHSSLVLGFSAWSKSPRLAGAAYAGFYFILALASGIIAGVLLERDRNDRMPQTIAIVSSLSVSGVSKGIGQSLYDVTPQQVVENFRQGRRLNRKRNNNTPPRPIHIPGRPPLTPMLLLAGALVVLPVAAAARKVHAVEVVRG